MAKSRKEIQKAYRERQKAKGSAFLEKERIRQRSYYKPASELSKKKREERNRKNKLRNRLSRLRKAERERNEFKENEETSGYESGIVPSTSNDEASQRLVIKLPAFAKRSKAAGLKKTRQRALARAHKSIGVLRSDVKSLRRKISTKNKQIERLSKKLKHLSGSKHTEVTPRKQAELSVEKLNLTPKSRSHLKRQLVVCNALFSEIKATKLSRSLKNRRDIFKTISGSITKKYRCMNKISTYTGLCRRSLGKVTDKSLLNIKERRQCLSRSIQSSVVDFMNRDDNSRSQPGKADVKNIGHGQKVQTRVLTDYLKNLHYKYICENPIQHVSLSTFRRLRPKNILLASFISRNTCQCVHHQNMVLKVQSLRKYGKKISENPENLLTNIDDIDTVLDNLPNLISFKTWKKVQLENGKTKMKIVALESPVNAFKDDFKKQLNAFQQHVLRVREQYQQVRALKERLPKNEIMVQMDFAENFSCRSLDEIQTAYWNQSMVTIHPVVVYFKENDELKHQSFVFLSDEMSHSASTVAAFLDQLIPAIKVINPAVTLIHYWTDSPSSQYRNRYIFNVIANHRTVYNVGAKWNYFEVGHGKGPCDGLGGTTKRMADEAIRQGNAVIQDAVEFHAWAVKSTMTGVRFIYVSSELTKLKQNQFNSIRAKPLRNTMKLHAVGMTNDPNKLMTRETSCYCATCLSGSYCDTWTVQNFTSVPFEASYESEHAKRTSTDSDEIFQQANSQLDEISPVPSSKHNTIPAVFTTLKVGDFVAAVYERKWYIGKVENIDIDEKDCEINFMKSAKKLFKWPEQPDLVWIDDVNILCKIEPPVPCGKSGRLFKIKNCEMDLIVNTFPSYK